MRLVEIANRPPALYHGTTSAHVPDIMRQGLVPRASHDNPDRIGIYLTDSHATADMYADLACDRRGGDACVVLAIDTGRLNSAKLEPDDWDLQNHIDDLHDNERQPNEPGLLTGEPADERLRPYRRWQEVPWGVSLAVTGQVVYTDTIPPAAIRVR